MDKFTRFDRWFQIYFDVGFIFISMAFKKESQKHLWGKISWIWTWTKVIKKTYFHGRTRHLTKVSLSIWWNMAIKLHKILNFRLIFIPTDQIWGRIWGQKSHCTSEFVHHCSVNFAIQTIIEGEIVFRSARNATFLF